MKQQSAKDLRPIPEAELQSQVVGLRQQLWQNRVKAKSGALQQVHHIRMLRRQVARIQTVLREQKKG